MRISPQSAPVSAAAPDNLFSLQALRGIAAMMVVLRHCLENTYAMDATTPLLALRLRDLGAAGVDVFFVISGFIMVYTSTRLFGMPGAPRQFLLRRLIRIAPLYWLVTIALALGLALVPKAFGELRFDAWHVAASFLFLPAYNSGGGIFPLLIPGWTLCYEMYFYLLFAVMLLLPRERLLPGLFGFFAVSVAMGMLVWPESRSAFVHTYMNPLLFEFWLGCALATVYRRPALHSQPIALTLIAAGVVLFAASAVLGRPDWHRLFYYGIPAVLLVSGCLLLEKVKTIHWPTPLLRVGDASYSLYLVHVVVIAVAGKVVRIIDAGHHLPPLAVVLGFFVASLVAGFITYRWFELPMLALCKRWFLGKSERATLALAK